MSPLTAWSNFYVIVGSSSGALIGLTFVVITLVMGRELRGANWGTDSFTTPTVVHFATALFICALLSAPWPAVAWAAVILALCGLAGVVYSIIIMRRMRRRVSYEPVGEDWVWYVIVPLVVYAALTVLAILLPFRAAPTLFGVAGVTLLLLFTAIHNAWDLVTYIATEDFDHPAGHDEREGETRDEA